MRMKILMNDEAAPGWEAEHGLSLLFETTGATLLFDTGASPLVLENLRQMRIDPVQVTHLVLSHGHYDHTGGVAAVLPHLPHAEVFYSTGLEQERFRQRDSEPPKVLTMPEECREALERLPASRRHELTAVTPISDFAYLTGPIPRFSGETTGGRFSLDAAGTIPDEITDEQALLFTSGVLVTGCCHAGIINTVEYCKKHLPEVPISVIVGGLHLLNADQARLSQTAEDLKQLKLKRLILLHCTGSSAAEYLKHELPFPVEWRKAGEQLELFEAG